jgi:hypothetical protein
VSQFSITATPPRNSYATQLGDGQLFAQTLPQDKKTSAPVKTAPKPTQAAKNKPAKPSGHHLEKAIVNWGQYTVFFWGSVARKAVGLKAIPNTLKYGDDSIREFKKAYNEFTSK